MDAALSEVPVNIFPLTDDTDFKSIAASVAYNAAGMALKWNFVTTAGAYTQTAVTPTTGGDYDWASQGNGMYSIEIPASGGASINNDTEGFGWFTGVATGVLPWRGPTIGFRAAGLNNALIDDAYSATRGLAGTALPAAAADAAGGLPISDAGGLDMDAILGDTNELQTNQGDWATATGFATAASLAAAQADLDTLTGADGATLATSQGNYAPAKAGDEMDLVNAPNATALAAAADALLDRDMSTGADNGSTTVRTVRQALRALRNKVSLSGSTMTVTKEDDSTSSWTATVTTDAAADPVTAIDPAGP